MTPGLLGQTGAAGPSTTGVLVVQLMVVGTVAVLFVLAPGAMVLFYRRPDVAATCAARDPVTRWTDRCSSQVLSLVVLWALGAVLLVLSPLLGGKVPVFGVYVRGAPATVLFLGGAGLCVLLAWRTARLDLRAWWAAQVVAALASVSAVVTISRQPVSASWTAMGLDSAAVEQAGQLCFGGRAVLIIVTVLTWAFFAVMLLHVLPAFNGPEERGAGGGCGVGGGES
jgi:hypothetical protein